MVGWVKMKLGMEEGHTVLDGDPAPLPKRGTAPHFSAHVCCGQTARWIKTPLGTKAYASAQATLLGEGRPRPRLHCVRWGPSFSLPEGAQPPPHFSAHVYCGQTVAYLSYCWALLSDILKLKLTITLGLKLCGYWYFYIPSKIHFTQFTNITPALFTYSDYRHLRFS